MALLTPNFNFTGTTVVRHLSSHRFYSDLNTQGKVELLQINGQYIYSIQLYQLDNRSQIYKPSVALWFDTATWKLLLDLALRFTALLAISQGIRSDRSVILIPTLPINDSHFSYLHSHGFYIGHGRENGNRGEDA